MAGRVARRRHDANTGPWLGLSVDLLERRPWEIRDMRKMRVVVLLPRVGEFALLHEDRRAREVTVAAGVVWVEVAVRDDLDIGDAMSCRAQRLLDRTHVHRPVEIDHLARLRGEAGVEKEHPTRVFDHERGHDDPLSGKAI